MALQNTPSGAGFRKQKRGRGRSDSDKQVPIKNCFLPQKSNFFVTANHKFSPT